MTMNLDYKSKYFHKLDESITFLLEINAIRREITCETCQKTIELKKYRSSSSYVYKYRCSRKICRFSRNLLSLTSLKFKKIEIPVLLFSIYLAIQNTPNHIAINILNITKKTYIGIKNDLVPLYDNILNDEEKMGGEGIVLEIDETVISRNGIIRSPSNADDSISNTIWLLGIIQRDNIRNFRLIVLP
ncbi:hypothetical protein DMUE_2790, partial [Dictyocoela muelleri]